MCVAQSVTSPGATYNNRVPVHRAVCTAAQYVDVQDSDTSRAVTAPLAATLGTAAYNYLPQPVLAYIMFRIFTSK